MSGYRKCTDEEVEQILNIKQISRTLLTEWFSPRVEVRDGKNHIKKPKFCITDSFDLPANTLLNNPKEVIDTTIGLYIYNFYVLSGCFGNILPYLNDIMTKKVTNEVEQNICNNVIMRRITSEQFAKYEKRIVWLGYYNEIFMPGINYNFLIPNKEVMKLKKQLLKEKPEILETNDVVRFHNEIEIPLMDKARELLKDDPAYPIYGIGTKPSFENNYKNTCITNGALFDPINNTRVINPGCYMEGLPLDKYEHMANKALKGQYDRGVETQVGGTWTKYLFGAMQNITLDKPGSDCGTTRLYKVHLTKQNINSFKLNYFLENGKLKMLSFDIIKSYIGKTVMMRTPLYCKTKKLCNMCFGELAYIQKFTNVGTNATKVTSVIMYRAMKSMHDITVNTRKIKLSDYITFV